MWMREAIRREKFPEIDELDNPKYFPYRYGQALWAFIGGKYGDRAIGQMLRAGAGRDGYKGAFTRVLGIDTKEASRQWHGGDAWPRTARSPRARRCPRRSRARSSATRKAKGGINVSPELSPDGSKIVFFSSRDLFSIDLYVADATTGKVIRKITDTATNAHLDSIEFIESAGAWSRDGRRFAFPGLSGGNPIITIVHVENGSQGTRDRAEGAR